MASHARLRLGTRASALARWQAEWVAAQLAGLGALVELVPITTQGDVKTQPLGQIGGQGLFTKELQRALLDDQIDLAVHSLKDLPTAPVEGLALAAVPRREGTADVLVCRIAQRIEDLPQSALVGTGSLRRKAQLLHLRPDLQIADIRGNIDTRLAKLDAGQFDAIILAEAGLRRLKLGERIASIIPSAIMLPAVGQGALGIECRAEDANTRRLVLPIDHAPSHQAVLAERSLLSTLRGGCLAPVGALAEVAGDQLRLSAIVLNAAGTTRITADGQSAAVDAIGLGQRVAEALLDQGAADLITSARTADRDTSIP